jgi:BON domain-containing protein
MRSWILQSVVALAVLSRTVGSADAEEPRIDDILQTMRVRQILHDDEELRGHNIGVQVENRVVILWGPVTKLDLGLRAESCLRGIPEIRAVRNEMVVQELPLRFAAVPSRTRPAPGMPIEPTLRTPPPSPPTPKRVPFDFVPDVTGR